MMDEEFDLEQADLSQEIDAPSDPGPAFLGRTPLVGSVRRSQGMPVIRDELGKEFGQKGNSILDF